MKSKFILLVLVVIVLVSIFPVSVLAGKDTQVLLKSPITKRSSSKSLVAHYKFDGDLKDSSSYGNDGKVSKGNITYVKGKFGEAAKFDGKSYVEVLDSDSLDLEKTFTISVWLCKEEVYNDVPVLSKGLGGDEADYGGVPYILWHDAAGTLPTLDIHEPNDWARISHYDGLDNFNTLHMITFTLDIPNKVAKLYVNGQPFKGEKLNWEFSGDKLNVSKENLFIGLSKNGDDLHYFNGYMDDLRIYNTVLSANEVNALYVGESQESKEIKEKKEYISINITPNTMAIMKEKGILYINATGVKPDGKKEDITEKTIYKSSNEKVCTVDKEGKVVGVSKGTATITVTSGDLKKQISLTVK